MVRDDIFQQILKRERFELISQIYNQKFQHKINHKQYPWLLVSCLQSKQPLQADLIRFIIHDPRVDLSAHGNWLLRWCCTDRKSTSSISKFKFEVAKFLMEERQNEIDVTQPYNMPLKLICNSGDFEMFQLFFRKDQSLFLKVDPNDLIEWLHQSDGNATEKFEIAKFIFKNEFLIDQNPQQPQLFFQWISEKVIDFNDSELLEQLLSFRSVDPTYNENQLLKNVASRGNLNILKSLLKIPKVCQSIKTEDVLSLTQLENSTNLTTNKLKAMYCLLACSDHFLSQIPSELIRWCLKEIQDFECAEWKEYESIRKEQQNIIKLVLAKLQLSGFSNEIFGIVFNLENEFFRSSSFSKLFMNNNGGVVNNGVGNYDFVIPMSKL